MIKVANDVDFLGNIGKPTFKEEFPVYYSVWEKLVILACVFRKKAYHINYVRARAVAGSPVQEITGVITIEIFSNNNHFSFY